MSECLTTYKKIKSIRKDLKDICGKLQKVVNNLTTDTYQTKGNTRLNAHSTLIAALFNSAENNLTEAHKVANALGSVQSNPKAAKMSFYVNKYSASKGIKIKPEEAQADAKIIHGYASQLEDLISIIELCRREFDSLNVNEQFVNSLTVIDYLFPFTVGASKYLKIVHIKNSGITNLKQAKKDIKSLVQIFGKIKENLNVSILQFASCENSVKARTYEDVIATTANITENSNVSNSDIKNKIAELQKKQKEYAILYGEECPEIAEEIARLKRLIRAENLIYQNDWEFTSKVGNRESLPYTTDGRNVGQCVGYAWARMKYLYPNLTLNSGNANQWLDNNKGNSGYSVVEGGWENLEKLKFPCVVVTKGAPYEGFLYGHVSVIEGITLNDDGSIKDIYFSESNGYDYNTHTLSSNGVFNKGIDGTMQRLSYQDFIKSSSRTVYGFIVPNI